MKRSLKPRPERPAREVSAREALAARLPAIDVRAPVEFEKGAMPGAVNLPILNDAERSQVGTTYKAHGAEAARRLGFELVSGATRAARIQSWAEALEAQPDAVLYCWRGGERSAIATRWLADAGHLPPRVVGGYKALRQVCLDVLNVSDSTTRRWWVLAGRTGSGKTDVIRALDGAIDLEGLAAHRGSAFGARDTPQPSPATFENHLACAMLAREGQPVVLEDESRTIGRLAVPEAVHNAMQQAPLALLEIPFEARVANIRREYVDERLPGSSAAALHEHYQGSLDRIRRRLGGERHKAVTEAMALAFNGGSHDEWIGLLLEWYYDPMYDYQLERKAERVQFTGTTAAVTEFLAERLSV